MLGGISGVSGYSSYYMNPYRITSRTAAAQGAASPAEQAQNAQRVSGTGTTGVLTTSRRPANLETPVQPVSAIKPVNPDARSAAVNLPSSVTLPSVREGADPVEMAVRMRIQPYEEEPENAEELGAIGEETGAAQGAEGAQKALEEGECQTCEKRKYQDGSDDSSVSFQTPTNIKPEQVASAVRGHELEHVIHEQAKAKQENRKVVSQSVTLHTEICPECGKAYISGGTTRTTTKSNPEQPDMEQQNQENQEKQNNERKPFSVAA